MQQIYLSISFRFLDLHLFKDYQKTEEKKNQTKDDRKLNQKLEIKTNKSLLFFFHVLSIIWKKTLKYLSICDWKNSEYWNSFNSHLFGCWCCWCFSHCGWSAWVNAIHFKLLFDLFPMIVLACSSHCTLMKVFIDELLCCVCGGGLGVCVCDLNMDSWTSLCSCVFTPDVQHKYGCDKQQWHH